MEFPRAVCYNVSKENRNRMNKRIKIGFFALILLVGISLSGFSQTPPDLKNIQKAVASFSGDLAKSLPFNSSLGLNWADAYIGKVFPSIPPHFGIGGSFGFTTMELPIMKELAGYLGYNLPFDIGKMFLPAYAAEGRLGGFFLPFDVGFKFGYLPPVGLWSTDLNMNYLMVGADIRYAILDGKSKVILPTISIGVGVNYLKGGVGGKVGSDQTISYGAESFTLSKPDINLKWDTLSLDFKAQISKSFLIITPYLGIGASYAWSHAGYSVDATVTDGGGGTVDIPAINSYLSSLGLDGVDVDSSGISSIIKNSAFNLRAFGGFSLNLMVFRLDFTGLYSFRDNNYGASFGFRFQL